MLAAALLVALAQDARQEAFAAEVLAALHDPAALVAAVAGEPWRAERLARDLLRQSVVDPADGWPLDAAEAVAAATLDATGRGAAAGEVARRRGWDEPELARFRVQEARWTAALEAASRGELDAARDDAAAALELAGGLELPGSVARAARTLARIELDLVAPEAALAHARRALAALPDDPLENPIDQALVARALEARATSAGIVGRYADALRDLAAATEAADRARDPALAARVRGTHAAVLSEVGRTVDATATLDDAERVLGEADAPLVAAFLVHTRGLVRLDEGDAAGALPALEDAAARYLAAGATTGAAAGAREARRQVGRALLALGRAAEARDAYAAVEADPVPYGRALALLGRGRASRVLGEDARTSFDAALALAEDLDASDLAWRAHDGLARVALAAGDLDGTRAHTRAALAPLARVEAALDVPALRLARLDGSIEVRRRAAWLAWRAGEPAAAFARAQEAKAAALAVERPPEAAAVAAARDEVARREAARTRALRAGAPPPDPRALDAAHAALAAATLAAELERGARPPHAPATLDALRAGLAPDGALLDVVLGDAYALAFVVRPSGLAVVELATDRARVAALVDRLDAPARALRSGRVDLANLGFDVVAAADLYDVLVRPLEGALAGAALVLVVPDGPLARAPLAALVRERVRAPVDPTRLHAQHAAHRYWVDDVALAVLPAAGFALDRPPPRAGRGLVVADPAPLPHDAPRLAAARAATAPRGATHLVGPAATEPAVRAALGRAGWAHLAVHGELDARRPAASRLALAPAGEDDGWLHAFELATLDLVGASIVLSACDSAGPDPGVAGALGLPRALLAAGASSVVANRWPADDAAAAALFAHRRAALAAGAPPAEALRRAQRALRAEGRAGLAYAHPFLWAGFVHHGAR